MLSHVFRKSTDANFALKLLTLLLSPLVFAIVWSFKCVRLLAALWIHAREGAQCVRLLDGSDAIFCVQETPASRAIITALFLVEYDGSGAQFHQKCQAEISSIFSRERLWKLNCEVARRAGYYYFKKAGWPISDHFQDLPSDFGAGANNNDTKEVGMDMEQLREAVSVVSNAPMPVEGRALWEARISQRPVMSSDNQKTTYAIVLRFHHVIGDAVTLFNMFSADFQTHNVGNTVTTKVDMELRPLNDSFTKKPFIAMSGMIDPPDANLLCVTSGSKHIVWCVEKQPALLDRIKAVKKNAPGNVTVVDVLLTCFLSSLDQYFASRNRVYPSVIYTVVPMMPPAVGNNGNFAVYGATNDYTLNNKISLGFLKTPLKMDSGGNAQRTILKRLELIRNEYDVFKNKSLDFVCNRWQGKVILTVLPHFMFKWLVNHYGISIMVSNVPGCNSLKFFGELKVKECIMVDPNTSISGVTLMITSYEDRLNFVYTIDKEVIANAEDVKEISKLFMHNLDVLQEAAGACKL